MEIQDLVQLVEKKVPNIRGLIMNHTITPSAYFVMSTCELDPLIYRKELGEHNFPIALVNILDRQKHTWFTLETYYRRREEIEGIILTAKKSVKTIKQYLFKYADTADRFIKFLENNYEVIKRDEEKGIIEVRG